MKQQKPDWWERAADECIKAMPIGKLFDPTSAIAEVLRAEHRWVVRMVQQEKRALTILEQKTRKAGTPQDMVIAEGIASRVLQCHDILTKLKARVL